MKVGDIA